VSIRRVPKGRFSRPFRTDPGYHHDMNHGGFDSLGFTPSRVARPAPHTRTEHVLVQRPLTRILAFTRRSIDDVVNNPLAKNEVYGYYKLHRQIERQSEVRELERQWNPLGT